MNTMEVPNKYLVPERNPVTHSKHRREVFWQIILPMLIGLLLVLTVVSIIIFSGTSSTSELSRWADVSMIWLILPSLFIALLFLIFLIAFTYLITVVLRMTPRYARILQLYFETGKYRVNLISDKITDPIIKSKGIWAVMRHPGRFVKPPPDEP
jgi:ABC-type sugar transport system permease subunit